MICAVPLSSEYARICGTCLTEKPPFSRVISYGIYEGILSEAITQFKFHGLKRFSKILAKLVIGPGLPQTDGIIPVPLSLQRLKERGFNQSLLIAKVISKELKTPLFMDNLVKTKDTPPQIGLPAKERQHNLRNAFGVTGDIKDLRLLLVDDVVTTGSTIRECSKVLMKAGAREVVALTLARAGLM